MAVATGAVALAPDDEGHLAVGLQPGQAVHHLHAASSRARAQAMLARSSKRAWSSTTAVTCLPDCDARIRAATIGLSVPVR